MTAPESFFQYIKLGLQNTTQNAFPTLPNFLSNQYSVVLYSEESLRMVIPYGQSL